MSKKASGVIGILICVFGLAALARTAAAVDTKDTRLLAQPAVGASRIAFVYANNIWLADLDGRHPRQITSDLGVENSPAFSSDGKWLAFSGQYEGNVDVYIMPAEGGVPRRLTWHPGPDLCQGFDADGASVYFISIREMATPGTGGLYRVPVQGGFPEKLPIPSVRRAAVSPDGRFVAYNPLADAFTQWKHYRGGRTSEIWVLKLSDLTVEKIPQPEGRSNDVNAMWSGDRIYFLSDRAGEFNLFAFDRKTKDVRQLTRFSDFPVLGASIGTGRIVFEQAGYLHLFNQETEKTTKLTVGVSADLLELRERYARGARWVRSGSISPSGARAAVEFRGEVVTVPAEKGDVRNLTGTPGAHERGPVWSPNGKSIAYVSDESGEYELLVRAQDGKGEPKRYAIQGAGFYDALVWSPDSRKISFADNSLTLYWVDIETGAVKKIAREYYYGPFRGRTTGTVWSPDSKWIAYTLDTKASIQQVHVYSLDQDKSFPVTDGLSEAAEPVFDSSGKYLYFLGSTDAGPVKNWFDQSNADMRMTSSIYLAVLRKDLPNPLAKESDEEKPADKADESKKDAKAADKKDEAKADKKPDETFRIDFEGLDHRILALPVPGGYLWNLQAGEEGQVYYLETKTVEGGAPVEEQGLAGALHRYDMKERKDDVVLPEVEWYQLTADKKKIGTMRQRSFSIVPAAGKPEPGKGRLNLEAIQVRVDPAAEWKQIFDEVWRINRDYFYDPGMHGADWPEMRAKYAAFLPHLSCRNDLSRLIQWLCSELAVGHSYSGGGDQLFEPRRVPGGLLGADFAVENGRYRFKKVYGGLNWNPELRSPLTEPGVDVRAGEYLLAVGGRDLRPPVDPSSLLETTAGKIVEIKVGPTPDGKGSRTVQVVPVADEYALRNRDWVEGNLKRVEEATNGRVAYVYVPDTATFGHMYFKRYFFPQADKDAIIIDERFNGGGSLADYYIDFMRREYYAMWATRYGNDYRTPNAMITGPKVMLINEMAGSGGDFLPWLFRKFGLGKLIGKRTWGGLVGILGFPVLMDGGRVTAPNLGIWTEDGFIVENEGVAPDIEVEQRPADVAAGRDPQLEKAIEVVLKELKAAPPKRPTRPPFPVRV
ncbi:MAG: PD40 domain-containing protein, partial [Candidatus Aminicenantes bacterium]|nr:PD40 domain-containing protein [Candidatus Aminicenantes bacterium]